MIDPDSIVVQQRNEMTTLKFGEIPEFDFVIYDLEDDSELKKYFKAVEREIRGSFEYRQMIKYLKENMNMNQCSFIQVSGEDHYHVTIEIHHYPFTLFDIVRIVYKKRCFYGEPVNVQMLAKECTMLHYQLLVGLIPLSVTAHQLFHAGKLFIPVDHVIGRYKLFVDFYKEFCRDEPEIFDALERIEKYSMEQISDLYNTAQILEQNEITIYNTDKRYQLPNFNDMHTLMDNRISEIKSNGYRLPTLEDTIEKKNKISKSVVSPLIFSKKE